MYSEKQIVNKACRPGVAHLIKNLVSSLKTKGYVARGALQIHMQDDYTCLQSSMKTVYPRRTLYIILCELMCIGCSSVSARCRRSKFTLLESR